MKPVDVFTPDQVNAQVNPAPISNYNIQLLAQGDSWFSLGNIPPWRTSNLFDRMGTSSTQACVVNCASPGQVLAKMTDTVTDQKFLQLLVGKTARQWGGLLISGGGNDLIACAMAGPNDPNRLLLTPGEWTTAAGAQRYLSNDGWSKFSDHLTEVIGDLLTLRDTGINKGIPVVMHTYDFATPRNAGAGLGAGPWLYKAVKAYGIPEDDWIALADELLGRLQILLLHIAATTIDNSLHIVSSQGTLTPASTTDTGRTTDWANEIHPMPTGYEALSALWTPVLDALFDPANAHANAFASAPANANVIQSRTRAPRSFPNGGISPRPNS